MFPSDKHWRYDYRSKVQYSKTILFEKRTSMDAFTVTELGVFFHPGYFGKPNVIFIKWSSQRFTMFWATFNLIFFHLNKRFQINVCCRYFKVSKVFCCRSYGLSNWASMLIFLYFCLSISLGLFSPKKLGKILTFWSHCYENF